MAITNSSQYLLQFLGKVIEVSGLNVTHTDMFMHEWPVHKSETVATAQQHFIDQTTLYVPWVSPWVYMTPWKWLPQWRRWLSSKWIVGELYKLVFYLCKFANYTAWGKRGLEKTNHYMTPEHGLHTNTDFNHESHRFGYNSLVPINIDMVIRYHRPVKPQVVGPKWSQHCGPPINPFPIAVYRQNNPVEVLKLVQS